MNETRFSLKLLFSAIIAAAIAAVFTINAFGLATPPRDIGSLLRPTALPTATRAIPTPTAPAAIAYAAGTRPLVIDDFTEQGNWPEGKGYGYAPNGFLLFPPSPPNFLAVPLKTSQPIVAPDLAIMATVQLTAPGQVTATTGIEYGTFFWHSSGANKNQAFLAFTVTQQGAFRLRGYGAAADGRAAQWTDIVPETRVPYLRRGTSPNQLRVELHTGRIRAYINDFPVLDRTNADVNAFLKRPGFDNQVGMVALSSGDASSGVLFTQFDLYALPSQ